MTKSIDTLVEDIYGLFKSVGPTFTPQAVSEFAVALAARIASKVKDSQYVPALRLSNIGTPCDRKLWYGIRHPELAEALPPAARIKFLFGDILEELLLFLARQSGHTVTDEQKEVEINGVKGHIDGKIDGETADCKSASSYSFNKFADGLKEEEDSFGYLKQLGNYCYAEKEPRGHFLVIDKTLGKICLDTHDTPDIDYDKIVDDKREMLSKDAPPARGYVDIAEGKAGNKKLGVVCSYCQFKEACWPGLRMVQYVKGPVFFTTIVKEPKVKE